MYRSLRPIYETLYKLLSEEFGSEGRTPVFQNFYRGFTLDPPALDYPYAFLEWGRVSDVELYESPDVYEYELLYRLFYLVSTGVLEDQLERQIFRREGDTESDLGIGDVADWICNYFWEQHHQSRFSEAFDKEMGYYYSGDPPIAVDPPESDWCILDFTVDGGIVSFGAITDISLLRIRDFLLDDKDKRALQINFTFLVREREVN